MFCKNQLEIYCSVFGKASNLLSRSISSANSINMLHQTSHGKLCVGHGKIMEFDLSNFGGTLHRTTACFEITIRIIYLFNQYADIFIHCFW